jgi:hypothetical protein
MAAIDPHLPLGIFLATGRCTLVAAVRLIRREKQKSVRAVGGGRLPAIHAKSQLTGGFQHARSRGIDPLQSIDSAQSRRSAAAKLTFRSPIHWRALFRARLN